MKISTSKTPTAQEAIDLFTSVGWGEPEQYNPEKWESALANNNSIITAYDGEKLIGMLRILSDEINDTHITDIIVHPDHQRTGIGQKLLNKAQEIFKHTAIYISCLKEAEDFFIKCGFKNKQNLTALAMAPQKEETEEANNEAA